MSLRWRRLLAGWIDSALIGVYAAALIPVGLLVQQHVWSGPSSLALNVFSFVVLIAPATWWLAHGESSGRAATLGKRLLGLTVRTAAGRRPGRRTALVRNVLKVALPWQIAHTGVIALVRDDPGLLGPLCAGAANLIALGYLVAVLIGTGRTPYDAAAGTVVRRTGTYRPTATGTPDSAQVSTAGDGPA